MKKIILPVLALAAALTVSCNKEQGTDSPVAKSSKKVTIEASIDGTKTYYANDKTFTWLAGDEISVMEELDGEVKFDVFTATAEGRTTSFDGEISEGATFGKWAVYPSNLAPAVEGDALSVTLPRYYILDFDVDIDGAVSSDNPMSILPLVGQKQEDGKYKFSTAMGIVKFSFKNVPENTYYFNVYSNGEPLYGTFSADEDGTVKMENYVSGGGPYAYWFVTPKEDKTLDVYLPLPVGTLTAGLEVWLENSEESELFYIETTKDIEVVRNRVTELAPLEVPDLEPVTLNDVFGDYEIEAYDYYSGYVFDNLTIEPSDIDDADAMITGSFLGHTIDAIYGVYDDETQQLIFPSYQVIYEDSENGTELVLVSCSWSSDDQYIYFGDFTDDGLVLQFPVSADSFTAVENPMPCIYLLGPGEEDQKMVAAYAFIDGSKVEEGGETSMAAPSSKAVKATNSPYFDTNKIKARKTGNVKVPFSVTGNAPIKEKIVKFSK